MIGPDLDRVVAERVMGLEHREWKPYCAPEGWYPKDAPECNAEDASGRLRNHDGYRSNLPCYSTDIAAAMEVVEKLSEHGHWAMGQDLGDEKRWIVDWWHDEDDTHAVATAETFPLAICRAALKAVRHTDKEAEDE